MCTNRRGFALRGGCGFPESPRSTTAGSSHGYVPAEVSVASEDRTGKVAAEEGEKREKSAGSRRFPRYRIEAAGGAVDRAGEHRIAVLSAAGTKAEPRVDEIGRPTAARARTHGAKDPSFARRPVDQRFGHSDPMRAGTHEWAALAGASLPHGSAPPAASFEPRPAGLGARPTARPHMVVSRFEAATGRRGVVPPIGRAPGTGPSDPAAVTTRAACPRSAVGHGGYGPRSSRACMPRWKTEAAPIHAMVTSFGSNR